MIHPQKNLQKIGEFANKKLGQNFLTSNSALNFLSNYISKNNSVLEIGPGFGAVTEVLQKFTSKITLVDTDKKIINFLIDDFSFPKENIKHCDFLKLEKSFILDHTVDTICGNLPFNISTPIIEKIVLEFPQVKTVIVGLQFEYAKRCTVSKGNSWSLFLQGAGDVKFIKKISKKAFYPEPNVDSAWIVWQRNQKVDDLHSFTTFLRCCFWAKRKNLYNNLRKNPYIEKFNQKEEWLKTCEERKESLQVHRPDAFTFIDILPFFDLFKKFLN